MKTIAIVNLKGGVGKTVTAVNVAAILATEYGQRVLLIDADPQANATQSLLPPGEYNTLAGLLTIPDVYYDDLLYHSSIRGLDVLPADDELRNLDVDLLQGERPNLRAIRDLRDAVAEDDAYDCIVIDCPPALSPACAAAIAVLDVMERDGLIENAATVGEYLLGELHKIGGLKEVRGRGLMIGIEIDGSGAEFRKRLLFGKHVFTGGAGASTVRLLPALCLTREHADRFLDAFDATLRGK